MAVEADNSRRWTPRTLLVAALVLVAAQTAVRGALALGGNLYWDDLILTGRSAALPLLSPEFLFYNHDGHLMPAAFLTAGITTALAPLQWWAAAVTLIGLQLLAALAVLRVLWLLIGPRPALLAVLALYLFAPLTVPSFAWWAAGLNSLPLQAALAWVAGDALLLARTGRRRYALTGTLVTALALAFFEKSVLVPFVAFAVVALTMRVDGDATPMRSAWRSGRRLWLGTGAVVAVWAPVYLVVAGTGIHVPPASDVIAFIRHGTSLGIVPTLLGGPWQWERWPPGPPWAAPPTGLVLAAWVVLAAAFVVTVRGTKRTGWVWAGIVAYVAASEVAMMLGRSGADTTHELAQTLRYTSDSAVILVLGLAILFRAPRRSVARAPRPDDTGAFRRTITNPVVVTALVAGLVASSVWSTVTFARSWQDNPGADYLATATRSLAEHRDVPLLDQPVSLMTLLPVAAPWNNASNVFAPLKDRPEFVDATSELRVLDESGRLVHATVEPARWTVQGSEPRCGIRIGPAGGEVPLTGPLMVWQWTAQLNYHATVDGVVDVGLGAGEAVAVPVHKGLNQAFVRIYGTGDHLSVRPVTPGLQLCLGAGPVGVVLPGTDAIE
ncbi:conserved membrane hypothetical protein [Rhodococcus sp. RD6.2]|uniref:hypothetical protein n=1 Tax=Rhodococcus sp. RD6.2 TaxID=260936 RepID=UPI00063B5113|nr:hypothetical protein [Rhodococcus sp. RD6.2]CRK52236.1 conserved membrane hypothetical protein [Rhodococcus sp. RD6.2]